MTEGPKFTFRIGDVRGSNTPSTTDTGDQIDKYKCEVGSAQTPSWLSDKELLDVKASLNGQSRGPSRVPQSSSPIRQDTQKLAQTQTWWANLAALGIMLGGGYLFLFFIIPFAFDVVTGDFSERWAVSSTYPETWEALDDESRKAFLRMEGWMRASVAKLPPEERDSEISSWWYSETQLCPYGEERRERGYKRCRSKADYELGEQMLDFFLDKKRNQ